MIENKLLANAVRGLSLDMVEAAKSGHPGAPLGMADFATVLWHNFLCHYPKEPKWPARDRFVLSNGHASALLYALLHLTGYDLTIADLKSFRQLNSKTPGHPEYAVTPGVEATTGPLGQGIACGVGMALAERLLAQEFNKEDITIVDNYTYVFAGDGCLMEGVSHESCSLAGTLGLNKLIMFWDNNDVSIDGNIKTWCGDNVEQRFLAYGWRVINIDGHNTAEIVSAIEMAKNETLRPTLINCQTIIGYGSNTLAGNAKMHSGAVGEIEVALIKKNLHLSSNAFYVDSEIKLEFDANERGKKVYSEWQERLQTYKKNYPKLHAAFVRRTKGDLPENLDLIIKKYLTEIADKHNNLNINSAARKYSGDFIEYITVYLPELFGGSADLSSSNLTLTKAAKIANKLSLNQIKQDDGNLNYLHYGVREFGMMSIMNGLALYGGVIPFGGTFLIFSDYAKPAIRLSALMRLKTILVLTHDSIALGEDGPTHQPIEQLAGLRAMPWLTVWRAATEAEVVIGWHLALKHQHPTALILAKQTIDIPHGVNVQQENIYRGAYIALEAGKKEPEIIIIATGSELELALKAALQLPSLHIRVVSMPSQDVFALQEADYQEEVLPKHIIKRLIIEAGSGFGWDKYAGSKGIILAMHDFGASGKTHEVMKEFDFTVENVCKLLQEFN